MLLAQQSVNPISGKVRRSHTGTARQCRCGGGSRRVFRQFSWLGVGSGKVALSRPAHQRVTQAVSHPFQKRNRFYATLKGGIYDDDPK